MKATKSTTAQEQTNPHMGQFVRHFFDRNRLPQAPFARQLGVAPSRLSEMFKRQDLKVSMLLALSHGYQHNFFADLAAMLPAHYVPEKPDTTLQDRIKALERQLEIVTAERDVLKEVMGKG